MDGELPRQGLLETNIMILRRWIDPAELPDEMAISAITLATGRKPRRRIADLMIAATAIAEDLPLFTTNPGDYARLDKLVRVVSVTRPPARAGLAHHPAAAPGTEPLHPGRPARPPTPWRVGPGRADPAAP
jgi:hypothetical protein